MEKSPRSNMRKIAPDGWPMLLAVAMPAGALGGLLVNAEWNSVQHLWTPEAAGWAAAFGTVYAARVALGLGRDAARRQQETAKARAAGAALVFLRPMLLALPTIENVKDYKPILKHVDILGSAAPTYHRNLLDLPAFTTDTTGVLLAELPITVSQWVSLAEQARLQMLKTLTEPYDDPWILGDAVVEHAEALYRCAFPAAEGLHELVYGPGADKPWTSGASANAKALAQIRADTPTMVGVGDP